MKNLWACYTRQLKHKLISGSVAKTKKLKKKNNLTKTYYLAECIHILEPFTKLVNKQVCKKKYLKLCASISTFLFVCLSNISVTSNVIDMNSSEVIENLSENELYHSVESGADEYEYPDANS